MHVSKLLDIQPLGARHVWETMAQSPESVSSPCKCYITCNIAVLTFLRMWHWTEYRKNNEHKSAVLNQISETRLRHKHTEIIQHDWHKAVWRATMINQIAKTLTTPPTTAAWLRVVYTTIHTFGVCKVFFMFLKGCIYLKKNTVKYYSNLK